MEEIQYTKQSETELKVITPVEVPTTTETVYDLDFLKAQEISILKSKNDFVDARNKELDEVRTLIAKCEELGVKSKAEISLAEEVAKEEIIN